MYPKNSVTRLGDFYRFLATNFHPKAAKIFDDILGHFEILYFQVKTTFGQLLKGLLPFLFQHVVTLRYILSMLISALLPARQRPRHLASQLSLLKDGAFFVSKMSPTTTPTTRHKTTMMIGFICKAIKQNSVLT